MPTLKSPLHSDIVKVVIPTMRLLTRNVTSKNDRRKHIALIPICVFQLQTIYRFDRSRPLLRIILTDALLWDNLKPIPG